MPRRRTPSGEESFHIKGSVLFSEGREPGRRLGTLVHELFAEIEWSPDYDQLKTIWRDKGLVSDTEDIVEAQALIMVKGVLDESTVASAFAKPSLHAILWRERAFDLVLDDDWVSGTFDRVILDRDETGRYISAWIVDFKTDDVPDETVLQEKLAGYRPQIALYRQAVSRLAGLPENQVRCSLLFTRLERLVEL